MIELLKNKNKLVTALAVISLLAILGIFAAGLIKNRNNWKWGDKRDVLGESASSIVNSDSFGVVKNSLENAMQNTLNGTKEIVGQKVVETEKVILESINKQLTDLTKSQVESVKVQICRDLGVLPMLTVSPSP